MERSLLVSRALMVNRRCVKKDRKVIWGSSYSQPYKCFVSTHAEMDVCRKLLKRNVYRKNEKIDIWVIPVRTGEQQEFANSRPCKHCIMQLYETSQKISITIKKVYYCTPDGITSEDFSEMVLNIKDAYITTGERRKMQNL
jgi:hypothetical protein